MHSFLSEPPYSVQMRMYILVNQTEIGLCNLKSNYKISFVMKCVFYLLVVVSNRQDLILASVLHTESWLARYVQTFRMKF